MTFLKRWWWILILGPLAAAIPAAYVANQSVDEYRSTATVLVVSSTGLEASERLTNTYGGLVKLRPVLGAVRARLNLDLSDEALAKKISVKTDFSNQLVRISVEDPEPLQSAAIANAAATIFVERTNQQVEVVTAGAPVSPAPGVPPPPSPPGRLLVVEDALPTAKSAKPNLAVNAGLAAGLGLLVAASIGIGLDSVGKGLRPEEA